MSNPYRRTSTPITTFVAEFGAEACFRLHLAAEKGLNGLLYRGEVAEFLLKESVKHRIGNTIRGVDLPENPGRKDFFVMVERDRAHEFTRVFEVSGAHPYMAAERA